jgi:hypothetical protein
VNREEVLAELSDDVLAVLKGRGPKQAEKVAAIVQLVADLLDPSAVAAIEVVGARIGVDTIELGNASIEVDANGDLSRVELHVPVDVELHGRE